MRLREREPAWTLKEIAKRWRCRQKTVLRLAAEGRLQLCLQETTRLSRWEKWLTDEYDWGEIAEADLERGRYFIVSSKVASDLSRKDRTVVNRVTSEFPTEENAGLWGYESKGRGISVTVSDLFVTEYERLRFEADERQWIEKRKRAALARQGVGKADEFSVEDYLKTIVLVGTLIRLLLEELNRKGDYGYGTPGSPNQSQLMRLFVNECELQGFETKNLGEQTFRGPIGHGYRQLDGRGLSLEKAAKQPRGRDAKQTLHQVVTIIAKSYRKAKFGKWPKTLDPDQTIQIADASANLANSFEDLPFYPDAPFAADVLREGDQFLAARPQWNPDQ